MSKFFGWSNLLLLTFVTLMQCNSGSISEQQKTLIIATAANMQFAMEALVKDFKKRNDIKCELIVGSSGKLTAQIKAGAPFDVLMSANMKYPEEIEKAGLALLPTKIYAYGRLVLWSSDKNIIPRLETLVNQDIKHVAVANPKTAPYGQAAVEVLTQLQIIDSVQSKLVYGESIAQVNQFITSGAAEIGFTAQSVVMAPKLQHLGNWISIDPQLYQPIAQGIVLIKRSDGMPDTAKQFYEYINTNNAKAILKKYGYATSTQPVKSHEN